MGQTKDLNVGPVGIGALLRMHMIRKTSVHRHTTHKRTWRKHIPVSHALDDLVHSHTKMMKLVMIGFAPCKSK